MNRKITITFLGSGTSQGVPVIACDCDVCISENTKDNRLRSSILVQSEKTCFVIDTGPDFRYQMLRAGVKKLDAVLYTHSHKDHIAGMDDIRAYNYLQDQAMDMYATEPTWEVLKTEFSYVFSGNNYPGIPQVKEIIISHKDSFSIGDIDIIPILVWHYKMPVLGFRIKDFVYITDANRIDSEELSKCMDAKYLVLNALRKETHISHFNLSEAISVAQQARAEQTYFTHISHLLGLHEEIQKELPENISLAYDGLKIEI